MDLIKISDWLKSKKLSLKVNKSKFIIFSKSLHNLHNIPNLYINNLQIERTNQTKFLGYNIQGCAHAGWRRAGPPGTAFGHPVQN